MKKVYFYPLGLSQGNEANRNMVIIGITGTLGAGKGTVVEYLLEKHAFCHYPVRDFLRAELERRHMPVNRDTLTAIANSLRAKHGPSYVIEELFREACRQGAHAVIESIRTPGEIDALSRHPAFHLLAVDADPRIRYQRIRKRNSETDQISYQEFLSNEEREMHTGDPSKQNLSACIERADHIIFNNGDLLQLREQTEVFLEKIRFPRQS